MTSSRKSALAAGVFYLITFISIPSLALYGPVFNDPAWIQGSGSVAGVRLATVLELIVALAGIGTALALYPVVKRQNQSFALGFVASRTLEAGMIFTGIMSMLSLVTLRQDLVGTTGADAASLVATGKALAANYNSAFLLGQSFIPPLNALLLGYLMYRSGLVPRILPVLGLIGAPLLFSADIGILLGVNEKISTWSVLAVMPIFVWELSLGLYLTFKGFRPAAVAALAADSTGTAVSTTPAPSRIAVSTNAGAA